MHFFNFFPKPWSFTWISFCWIYSSSCKSLYFFGSYFELFPALINILFLNYSIFDNYLFSSSLLTDFKMILHLPFVLAMKVFFMFGSSLLLYQTVDCGHSQYRGVWCPYILSYLGGLYISVGYNVISDFWSLQSLNLLKTSKWFLYIWNGLLQKPIKESSKNLRQNTNGRVKIEKIKIDEWLKYYSELLQEKWNIYLTSFSEIRGRQTEEITESEIRNLLKNIINNKATEPRDMPVELLKHASSDLILELKRIFNICLFDGELPREWKIGYQSSIQQKRNKKDPNNYRGICMLPSAGKLYGKMVKERIKEQLEWYSSSALVYRQYISMK